MNRFLLPLFLLGTLLVAGCSSPPGLAGLQVELSAVERQADGSAIATVRVVNPTTVSYNVAGATHRVFLDERPVGVLEIKQPMGVPSQNTGLHTGLLTLEKGAALNAGPVAYRLESKVVIVLWGERQETTKLAARGSVTVK